MESHSTSHRLRAENKAHSGPRDRQRTYGAIRPIGVIDHPVFIQNPQEQTFESARLRRLVVMSTI